MRRLIALAAALAASCSSSSPPGYLLQIQLGTGFEVSRVTGLRVVIDSVPGGAPLGVTPGPEATLERDGITVRVLRSDVDADTDLEIAFEIAENVWSTRAVFELMLESPGHTTPPFAVRVEVLGLAGMLGTATVTAVPTGGSLDFTTTATLPIEVPCIEGVSCVGTLADGGVLPDGGGPGGPPDTLLDAFPANPSPSASASFRFHASVAGATFRCTLDSGTTESCTSPHTYTGLSEGPHSFAVAAVDPGGTADPTPATHQWTVDTIPPTTTLTAKPADPSNLATPSVSFTADEAGSTFSCRLDAAAAAPCVSPLALGPLSDGAHTFQVVAADPAGNRDPAPPLHVWTVDTIAPETTFTGTPPAANAVASASFSFACSEAGCTFRCGLDGAEPQVCTSPFAMSGLSDATHTFRVFATDAAGNPEPTPAEHTWTVDTTPPASPGGLTVTPGFQSLVVSWAAVSDAVAYKAHYQAGTNAPPYSVTVGPLSGTTSTTLTGLASCQAYTVSVTALDAAGNESDFATPLTVSTLPPPQPLGLTAQGGHGAITLSWSQVPGASGYRVFYGATSGGPYDGNGAFTGPSPVEVPEPTATLRGLAPHATWYLSVAAVDGACEGARSAEVRSAPYPWRWRSPTPTGNDLRAIDCIDALTCVAVGNLGTVVRTTDGGTTWSVQNGGTAADFSDLQMVDPSLGFALTRPTATGPSRLFRTIDGGVRWREVESLPTEDPATGVQVTALNALFFLDSIRGWLVGDGGVILGTIDGGETWFFVPIGTTEDLRAIYAFDDGRAIVLSTIVALTPRLTGPVPVYSVWCVDPLTCWAAGEGGMIFKSGADGSGTGSLVWFEQTSGVDVPLRRIRFVDALTGWAVGDGGTLLSTTNGGMSWNADTSGESEPLLGLYPVDGTSAYVVGGGGAIRKLAMGPVGPVWSSQRQTITTATLNAVRFPDADTGVMAGIGGLILRTTDGGGMWSPASVLPTTSDLRALVFPAQTVGFAAGAQGTILRTDDAGQSWTPHGSFVIGADLNAIYCLDADTCWVGGAAGAILGTTNGGQLWEPHPSAPWTVSDIFFADAQHGWVAINVDPGTAGAPVAYTLDGGDTWTPVSIVTADPFETSGRALLFQDSSTGWLAGGAGCGLGADTAQILHTSSAGTAWQLEASAAGGCFVDLARGTDGALYAVGTGGLLWKRVGGVWKALPTVTRRWGLHAVAEQAPGRIWVVGQSGVVLETRTGGE